jgi:hypothetical protein
VEKLEQAGNRIRIVSCNRAAGSFTNGLSQARRKVSMHPYPAEVDLACSNIPNIYLWPDQALLVTSPGKRRASMVVLRPKWSSRRGLEPLKLNSPHDEVSNSRPHSSSSAMWTHEKQTKNPHLRRVVGVGVGALVLLWLLSNMKLSSSVLGVGLLGLPAFAEILGRQSNADQTQK